MAAFGYSTRSRDTSRNGRDGPRFLPQNSAFSGESYWTQPAVAYDSRPPPEVYRDHVCRPVAVDAYGRPIPGVVVLPADQHVTQTEYVTEQHVYSRTHPNHNQAGGNLLDCDNGKCKPLLSPTGEQVLLPNKVNEFITSVQTETSLGPRTGGFPSGMFQRRGATGGAGRNLPFDPENSAFSSGRNWNRQLGREEEAPPAWTYEQSTMTRPSSDVGALAEYVREAARPKVGRPTAGPAAETIDHNEAQRRYNNKVPTTGASRVDPSLPTIDHRQAALKYKGALVN